VAEAKGLRAVNNYMPGSRRLCAVGERHVQWFQ